MPEISFDPSCEAAAEQLAPFAETHRLTVICGLIAPATGELALVRSVKAIDQETPDEALKPAQGGIKEGETAAEAFLRELTEEFVDFDIDGITTVFGIPMNDGAMTGGRARAGRPRKAFAVLCGIMPGRPHLEPNPDELISANWYTPRDAEDAFQIQVAHPHIYARGMRNLRILDAIAEIDPTKFSRS
jgi:hypothetical protein